MDAFPYIIDFLASSSDEDTSLPVNEEDPTGGNGGTGWCVIA
jgi:Fungal mating-type pheromone